MTKEPLFDEEKQKNRERHTQGMSGHESAVKVKTGQTNTERCPAPLSRKSDVS